MNTRKYHYNNSTMTIVFGNILDSKAEVIVSSDDTGISMAGGISGAIRKAGGDIIREDAQKKLPAQVGDVIVSTSGSLAHQKYVFHCLSLNFEHKISVIRGRTLKRSMPSERYWTVMGFHIGLTRKVYSVVKTIRRLSSMLSRQRRPSSSSLRQIPMHPSM